MYPHIRMPRHVTGLYMFAVANILAVFQFSFSLADVIVVSRRTNYTVDIFADIPANFGRYLPTKGMLGYLVYAEPDEGCSEIAPPPEIPNPTGNWVVLIKRGVCTFGEKVKYAQNSGYNAAIVHNVGSNSREPMNCEGKCDIYIPSLFVGQDDGYMLKERYQYDKKYLLLLTPELPFNLNQYLLPFAIVVGICFIVMLGFMIGKCVRDTRRARRYRMPSRSLKKIPVIKFRKGDPYDCCAICLDDYSEGDKLRVLPCSHAFHTKCVDPWLTRTKRVCPCCKRKVFAQDEHQTDSSSDSEGETAPLVRNTSRNTTRGGTFDENSQPQHPVAEGIQNVVHAAAAGFGRRNRNGYTQLLDDTVECPTDSDSSEHSQTRFNFEQTGDEDVTSPPVAINNLPPGAETEMRTPVEIGVDLATPQHNGNVRIIGHSYASEDPDVNIV